MYNINEENISAHAPSIQEDEEDMEVPLSQKCNSMAEQYKEFQHKNRNLEMKQNEMTALELHIEKEKFELRLLHERMTENLMSIKKCVQIKQEEIDCYNSAIECVEVGIKNSAENLYCNIEENDKQSKQQKITEELKMIDEYQKRFERLNALFQTQKDYLTNSMPQTPTFPKSSESKNQPSNHLGTKNDTPMYDKDYFTSEGLIPKRSSGKRNSMSLPNFHQLRESQNQPLNLLGTKNGTPMYDKNYFTNKNKILLRTKKVHNEPKDINIENSLNGSQTKQSLKQTIKGDNFLDDLPPLEGIINDDPDSESSSSSYFEKPKRPKFTRK